VNISRETLIKLMTLGLNAEQAEAVVDVMFGDEEGDHEPGSIQARRAADRERQRRYRARASAADDNWLGKRNAVFERDSYICTYCGADVRDDPHCDHVVPLLQGGSNEIENLTTACQRCNSAKAGKTLKEWGGPSWGSSLQQ
jgi:5-methylcytosine-specific restriction endonuclease McrA